jgi:hypothetical protein
MEMDETGSGSCYGFGVSVETAAHLWAKIQTQNLLNMKQEHYLFN